MEDRLEKITKQFPDWKELEPGNWSAHSIFFQYGEDDIDSIEVGLYREPLDEDKEIAGTYTLQGFDGDDVIFCHTVVGLKGE